MEFYEITTGTSQKDIDDAINDIKKITTDLFTQSFMSVSYTHLTLPTTPYV